MTHFPYLYFYHPVFQQVVQKDDVTLKINSQSSLYPVVMVHLAAQVFSAAPQVLNTGGKYRRDFVDEVAYKISSLLIGCQWNFVTVRQEAFHLTESG